MKAHHYWRIISGGSALFAVFMMSGCEQPKRLEVPPPPPEPVAEAPRPSEIDFPVRWTLTDLQGRQIEATIIGRGVSSVTLVREKDGRRYDFPLENLSSPDRLRVDALPLRAAPAPGPEAAGPPVVEIVSGATRMKRSALAAVQEELRETGRLLSESESAIKSRSLQSKMDKLIQEEQKLTAELAELESR